MKTELTNKFKKDFKDNYNLEVLDIVSMTENWFLRFFSKNKGKIERILIIPIEGEKLI